MKPITGNPLLIDYNIEGSDVGYRWYARQGLRPLFPFGFGLRFTTFRYSQLEISEDKATVTVTNTGERDGQDVVQPYLTALPTKKVRRLVGFDKISLKPGESRSVQIPCEKRVLAHWANGHRVIDPGEYRFAVGQSAEDLGPDGAVRLTGAKWN